MGIRLIEEFLAKSGVSQCENFKETAQVIAKVAFKMFLGTAATVTKWTPDNKSFFMVRIALHTHTHISTNMRHET